MQDGVRGLWGWFGRRDPAPVLTQQARIVNPYHAVSIITGEEACEAAKACTGERFLSRGAPRLPLPGCDRTDCRCHYAHHTDRRGMVRRVADGREAAPGGMPYKGPERRLRVSAGRRDGDGP